MPSTWIGRRSWSRRRTGSPDGRTPQQALAEARDIVLGLYATESRVWSQELLPALAACCLVGWWAGGRLLLAVAWAVVAVLGAVGATRWA